MILPINLISFNDIELSYHLYTIYTLLMYNVNLSTTRA